MKLIIIMYYNEQNIKCGLEALLLGLSHGSVFVYKQLAVCGWS